MCTWASRCTFKQRYSFPNLATRIDNSDKIITFYDGAFNPLTIVATSQRLGSTGIDDAHTSSYSWAVSWSFAITEEIDFSFFSCS